MSFNTNQFSSFLSDGLYGKHFAGNNATSSSTQQSHNNPGPQSSFQVSTEKTDGCAQTQLSSALPRNLIPLPSGFSSPIEPTTHSEALSPIPSQTLSPIMHNPVIDLEKSEENNNNLDPALKKTIMCFNALKNEQCPMRNECPHAHNLKELELRFVPRNFKKEPCQYPQKHSNMICTSSHPNERIIVGSEKITVMMLAPTEDQAVVIYMKGSFLRP